MLKGSEVPEYKKNKEPKTLSPHRNRSFNVSKGRHYDKERIPEGFFRVGVSLADKLKSIETGSVNIGETRRAFEKLLSDAGFEEWFGYGLTIALHKDRKQLKEEREERERNGIKEEKGVDSFNGVQYRYLFQGTPDCLLSIFFDTRMGSKVNSDRLHGFLFGLRNNFAGFENLVNCAGVRNIVGILDSGPTVGGKSILENLTYIGPNGFSRLDDRYIDAILSSIAPQNEVSERLQLVISEIGVLECELKKSNGEKNNSKSLRSYEIERRLKELKRKKYKLDKQKTFYDLVEFLNKLGFSSIIGSIDQFKNFKNLSTEKIALSIAIEGRKSEFYKVLETYNHGGVEIQRYRTEINDLKFALGMLNDLKVKDAEGKAKDAEGREARSIFVNACHNTEFQSIIDPGSLGEEGKVDEYARKGFERVIEGMINDLESRIELLSNIYILQRFLSIHIADIIQLNVEGEEGAFSFSEVLELKEIKDSVDAVQDHADHYGRFKLSRVKLDEKRAYVTKRLCELTGRIHSVIEEIHSLQAEIREIRIHAKNDVLGNELFSGIISEIDSLKDGSQDVNVDELTDRISKVGDRLSKAFLKRFLSKVIELNKLNAQFKDKESSISLERESNAALEGNYGFATYLIRLISKFPGGNDNGLILDEIDGGGLRDGIKISKEDLDKIRNIFLLPTEIVVNYPVDEGKSQKRFQVSIYEKIEDEIKKYFGEKNSKLQREGKIKGKGANVDLISENNKGRDYFIRILSQIGNLNNLQNNIFEKRGLVDYLTGTFVFLYDLSEGKGDRRAFEQYKSLNKLIGSKRIDLGRLIRQADLLRQEERLCQAQVWESGESASSALSSSDNITVEAQAMRRRIRGLTLELKEERERRDRLLFITRSVEASESMKAGAQERLVGCLANIASIKEKLRGTESSIAALFDSFVEGSTLGKDGVVSELPVGSIENVVTDQQIGTTQGELPVLNTESVVTDQQIDTTQGDSPTFEVIEDGVVTETVIPADIKRIKEEKDTLTGAIFKLQTETLLAPLERWLKGLGF